MSILLLVVGAIAVMLGVGMAAWGIPINEFSFGNTLIVAGTTMASGGLIVVGLGAAVGQLHRIAEALTARNAIAESHAFEAPPEAPVAGAPVSRMPFPSEPRGEPLVREPLVREPFAPAAPPPPEREPEFVPVPEPSAAPTLPNPEAEAFAFAEDVSLSPPAEPGPEEKAPAPPRLNGGGAGHPEPAFAPRRPPLETPISNFDAMWPEPAPPSSETRPEPPESPPAPEEKPAPAAAPEQPHEVAILKSGVVDGMAYTLYVDGSIEAELPQGTVRFASIDELRSHLQDSAPS